LIPKTFKLVNRTWVVKEMSKSISSENKLHGDCDHARALIRVCIDHPENAEHTFFHELAHAMLKVTTKPKLSSNEDFVDSLGAALHQYMQTKKGEL
jgi:hypothetical protein